MANELLRVEVDTHDLENELSLQSKRMPTFIREFVRRLTEDIYRNARDLAPRRGDRPRLPGESPNPTARGASYRAGNLRAATRRRILPSEGVISIDEEAAPYWKYVMLPTRPKLMTGLTIFPDTRRGHSGRTVIRPGRVLKANPVQNFLEVGFDVTDVNSHVDALASKAGNLPRLGTPPRR